MMLLGVGGSVGADDGVRLAELDNNNNEDACECTGDEEEDAAEMLTTS